MQDGVGQGYVPYPVEQDQLVPKGLGPETLLGHGADQPRSPRRMEYVPLLHGTAHCRGRGTCLVSAKLVRIASLR